MKAIKQPIHGEHFDYAQCKQSRTILIKHTCEDCGVKFEVIQGSRRRFCLTCEDKRKSEGSAKGAEKQRKEVRK